MVTQIFSDHQIPSDTSLLHMRLQSFKKSSFQTSFKHAKGYSHTVTFSSRCAMPTLHNPTLLPHSALMPHPSSSSPGFQLLNIILVAASAPYTNPSSTSRGKPGSTQFTSISAHQVPLSPPEQRRSPVHLHLLSLFQL